MAGQSWHKAKSLPILQEAWIIDIKEHELKMTQKYITYSEGEIQRQVVACPPKVTVFKEVAMENNNKDGSVENSFFHAVPRWKISVRIQDSSLEKT